MSMVELLRHARDSYAVKYREFIILYSKCKNVKTVICFFEEEDSKYYGIRIRSIMPEHNYKTIQCHGKKDVLKLCSIIKRHKEYKKATVGFFIDRDYDDLLRGQLQKYIYETPCYSVENFYTTSDSVGRILKDEFKIMEISDDDTNLDQCIRLYDETKSKFHDAIEELNAWIMCERGFHKNNPNNRINLRTIRLDRLVAINIGSVIKKYDIDRINEIFPNAMYISNEEVQKKLSCIDKHKRGIIFRGKYEIEFLRIFLTQLKQDRNSSHPKLFKKRTMVRLSLSRGNMISELSQYAETPECLVQYLEKLRDIKKAA